MCVTCHGEPGREPSEIGRGLNPEAPELSKSAQEWSDSELHWIIRNGIKMSGMPGFGETHDDKEIWAIATFLRTMSGRTPDQYRRLLDSLEEGEHRDSQGKHKEPAEEENKPALWKKKSLF
jgi:mono/diheme cytochrome c family protein